MSPDSTMTPLRVARDGSALNVVGVEGDWYRVEFQDPQYGRRVGYIEKRHVTAQQAAPDLSAPNDVPQVSAPMPRPAQPRVETVVSNSFFVPTVESMTGWGIQRSDGGTSKLGWSTSVANTLAPWFSVVGEFTGNYSGASADVSFTDVKADLQDYGFLGGGKFVGRLLGGRLNPFAQVLTGATVRKLHFELDAINVDESKTVTYFTLQPGGGLDVALTDRVALRMQFDARTTFKDGGHGRVWRFTPGVVFRSGSN